MINLSNLSGWNEPGDYTCNHIGCEAKADYIVGTSHRDYSHFCKDHLNEYDNEGLEIIPNIREERDNG